jgi:hypothetical protein
VALPVTLSILVTCCNLVGSIALFTFFSLIPGVSAHQKLDLLSNLVQLLGFESVAVFGDCFDEVTLLDPVRFPGRLNLICKTWSKFLVERMIGV